MFYAPRVIIFQVEEEEEEDRAQWGMIPSIVLKRDVLMLKPTSIAADAHAHLPIIGIQWSKSREKTENMQENLVEAMCIAVAASFVPVNYGNPRWIIVVMCGGENEIGTTEA